MHDDMEKSKPKPPEVVYVVDIGKGVLERPDVRIRVPAPTREIPEGKTTPLPFVGALVGVKREQLPT
jgi:hypothetical protein